MALAQIDHLERLQVIAVEHEVERLLRMPQGYVERALGGIERRLVVIPDIGSFAAPHAGLGGQQLACLNDILECAELMNALADLLIHRGIAAVILRVGELYGAKLEQVEYLGAMSEVAIKLPPPVAGEMPRRMRHDVVVNTALVMPANGRAEHVEHDEVH